MNTLLFLCGAGVGALISSIILLLVIRLMAGKTNAKGEEFNVTTIALMRERNFTDKEIAKHLSTLAEWANHNWSK